MQRDNLPHHYSRVHYNNKGKAKRTYRYEKDAERYIKRRNLKGYSWYVCPICNKIHIGTSNGEPSKTTNK